MKKRTGVETDMSKSIEYGSPVINGCSIVSFSRMSRRCMKCEYRDYCESKTRESVAHIVPDLRPDQKIEYLFNEMNLAGITVSEASDALNRAMRCASRRE